MAEQGFVIAMPTDTHDLEPDRNGSSSPPLAIPFLHTRVIRRGATLLHKLITPSQMASLVCGLTAAPCPYLYEHRQTCPGVTQAVLYEPCFLHPHRKVDQDWQGSIQALALPFSNQIPDCAVPHTFVQPINCLMSQSPASRRPRH